MHALTSFLLLTLTVAAQASMEDDVNATALSQHPFFFDVTSDAGPAAVKGALDGKMTIRHCFREIGTNRYLIVARGHDPTLLKQIEFPVGSIVDQYPVECMKDFLDTFLNLTSNFPEEDSSTMFSEGIVEFGQLDLKFREGTTVEEYEGMLLIFLRKAMAAYNELVAESMPVNYAAVSRYPPRFFTFAKIGENALQKLVLDSVDKFGGPGNVIRKGKMVLSVL